MINPRPIRPGSFSTLPFLSQSSLSSFGFGGLAKSLRDQADQIGKSAKDAVNKAQQNAENVAARMDQGAPRRVVDQHNQQSNDDSLLGIVSSSNVKSPLPLMGIDSQGSKIASGKIDSNVGLSLASRSPEDVSKEELLEILQKMNKRVKALSSLRVTLTDRVKASESDRTRIIAFIKQEILSPADLKDASVAAGENNAYLAEKQAEDGSLNRRGEGSERVDEIGMLQIAIRMADERKSLSVQAIQAEYKNLAIKHKNEIKQLEDKAKSEQAAAKTTVTENPNNVEDSAGSTEKWGEEVERITRRHREEIERIQEGHRFELHRVTNELKTRPEPPPSIQVQNVTDQNVVNAYEENIQILTQANEEKLKEVRLEAAQQIKDAYERKLETIKEKAKLFVEKTKREAAENISLATEQIQQLKQEVDKNKRQSENIALEKDTEMISLRSRLEEMEKSLDAKTAEAIQLEKEAAQKLEEDRERFEGTMASLKEEHEMSMAAVKKEYEAQTSSVSEEKDTEMISLRTERNHLRLSIKNTMKEVEDLKKGHANDRAVLKQELEGKANVALEKHAKAMKYINKLKLATAEKIKVIGQERATELEDARQENRRIIEEVRSTGVRELKEAKIAFEKNVAELKKGKEALEEELSRALDVCDTKHEEARSNVDALIEEKVEHTIKEQKRLSDDEIQKILAEKKTEIEIIVRNHSETLQKVEAKHQRTMDDLKTAYDTKLESAASENSAAQAGLELKMSQHADDLKAFYDEKMKSLGEKSAADIGQKEESLTELTKKVELMQVKIEGHVHVEESLRISLKELKEEASILSSKNAAASASLTDELTKLNEENDSIKGKMAKLVEERKRKGTEVVELHKQLEHLQAHVSNMTLEKVQLEEKIQKAAKQENKLSVSESEVTALREELNKSKLNESKNASLVSRLQSDQESSERKHGQQTALIGMLEAQLAELNESKSELQAKLEVAAYDLRQKDEHFLSVNSKLEKAERALAHQASRKVHSDNFAQHAVDVETAKKAQKLEELQREIKALQQQMARKSSAAQKLLQEREAECNVLRKSNKVLQKEVDKGSLSDRRIFELAAQQSNRESVAVAEIDLRDKLVQRLAEKLESRDSDLASAEYTVQKVEGQVEELCRVRRREDVNLDYLKSIVVQYLSKPSGSSERAALLPVLATLLQFDSSDYEAIQAGKAKVSWWGGVLPTYINPPTTPMAPITEIFATSGNELDSSDIQSDLRSGSSAEVSVSRQNEKDLSSQTKLTF